MIFRQILDEAKGCASYLLGCDIFGRGCVVDPLGSVGVEEYLLRAAEFEVEIVDVFETHLHADHRSVACELAAAAGARLHLYAGAPVSYPHASVQDGQELAFGSIRVRVMHTPGHTDESYSLLVWDRLRSEDEPWLVLTGDSLLAGDVARPDLVLGVPRPEAVRQRVETLYDSLWARLLTLPDWVEVYPGHFGASPCGGVHLNAKTATTIGFERRHNAACVSGDRERFARFVLSTLRPEPEDYRAVKSANATSRPGVPLDEPAVPRGDVLPVVDLRPERAYLAAHVPGSVNRPFLRPFTPPVPLFTAVAPNGVVARAAGAVGWCRLEDWEADGRPVDRVDQVGLDRISDTAQLIDLRQPSEWASGLIPGARCIPEQDMPGDLCPEGDYVLCCATGIRSAAVARRLRGEGFLRVSSLAGGLAAWRLAGRVLRGLAGTCARR